MAIRVGINGFGRIGRNFFRAAREAGSPMEIVAVNDLCRLDAMAHLLEYDSVLGPLPDDISAVDDGISVNGHRLQVLSKRSPSDIPWAARCFAGDDRLVVARLLLVARGGQCVVRHGFAYPLVQAAQMGEHRGSDQSRFRHVLGFL